MDNCIICASTKIKVEICINLGEKNDEKKEGKKGDRDVIENEDSNKGDYRVTSGKVEPKKKFSPKKKRKKGHRPPHGDEDVAVVQSHTHCTCLRCVFFPGNWVSNCRKDGKWCRKFISGAISHGKNEAEKRKIYKRIFGHLPDDSKLSQDQKEQIKKRCGSNSLECVQLTEVAIAEIEVVGIDYIAGIGVKESEKTLILVGLVSCIIILIGCILFCCCYCGCFCFGSKKSSSSTSSSKSGCNSSISKKGRRIIKSRKSSRKRIISINTSVCKRSARCSKSSVSQVKSKKSAAFSRKKCRSPYSQVTSRKSKRLSRCSRNS